MKSRGNRPPSWGFLVVGGMMMWLTAGFFTSEFSLGGSPDFSGLSFSCRAGFVWAVVGFFFVAPLPTWFNMSLERQFAMFPRSGLRSNFRAAFLTQATRAVFLGAIAGYVLARWVMPHLGVPEGLVLSNSRMTPGAVLTAIAYLICIPSAARVAQTFPSKLH
jgi:hypothetical protein